MTSTEYVLSIDPGHSSGISLLSYGPTSVPELEAFWQFLGGAEALNDWANRKLSGRGRLDVPGNLTVVAEKFNARSTTGFSYTTKSLEALRCEGVLISRGLPDDWVQPPQQYIFGGSGKADKKKRQHRALKELGYYVTGKDVGQPDVDDIRSSIAHALSWLMRNGHKPTYEMMTNWNERGAS